MLSRLLGGAPWESKAYAECKAEGIKCFPVSALCLWLSWAAVSRVCLGMKLNSVVSSDFTWDWIKSTLAWHLNIPNYDLNFRFTDDKERISVSLNPDTWITEDSKVIIIWFIGALNPKYHWDQWADILLATTIKSLLLFFCKIFIENMLTDEESLIFKYSLLTLGTAPASSKAVGCCCE